MKYAVFKTLRQKHRRPKAGHDTGNYVFILLAIGAIIIFSLYGCGHLRSKADSEAGVTAAAIDFYQGPLDHLSAVRAGACPMYPGCADYTRRAVKKHGPIIGWVIACDRLIRCGRDALDRCPRVLIDGTPKYFDPLPRNDWWWDDPDRINPLQGYPRRAWQISID
ncbi:MAG: membrane protein insertion efficiency factor YidD [Desulfobacterales bacterium]|nr:membrane protein insertion efficiency factor YidD [Desulfobacterales bacterium]